MKNTFLISLICFVFNQLIAQQPLRVKHFNLEKGVAAQGYDVVSYYSEKVPKKGDKKFSVSHIGVVYYFSTEANKELFKKNPQNYELQYGGWCAYAMGSSGEKVEIDPETFKIIDGKLYLFYNQYFNNTLKDWNKNEKKLKHQADQNWEKIYR